MSCKVRSYLVSGQRRDCQVTGECDHCVREVLTAVRVWLAKWCGVVQEFDLTGESAAADNTGEWRQRNCLSLPLDAVAADSENCMH